jgi:integrase|tara:strand:- start:16749 stop:19208 length:2460 start_codon:yes stop_codon:yes gene_type:complete
MHAATEESVYPNTTAAILEATAETPLHRAGRHRLALEPVSSRSLWGDPRWVFDNATSGSEDNQSTISWNLDLQDGHNLLDPHHANLLDWLRRLVWSAFAAPGDGATSMKPGSLSGIGVGLRYWVAWLVEREIAWPHQIGTDVVATYQDHLQGDAENDADTEVLTHSVAYCRLMPFALLWRQRFALERAGIAPMPAAPFGRAGLNKIAKKIASVAVGSYRPLPDEVAILVLNTAMAMLETPAADVIALAEACAGAFALGMAETVGPDRRKALAEQRQSAAAKAFRFEEINGRPWHGPLDPDDWEAEVIAVAQCKLQTYLETRRADLRQQTGGRPTLKIYRQNGRACVDLRGVVLDLGLKPGDEQLLCRHPALHALIDATALEQRYCSVPLIGVLQRVRQLVLTIRSAAHLVIQATTGMRISEICGLKAGINPATGLPLSVQVQDSLNGLSEVFILVSDLSKTEETPRAVPWVVGYRPKGSTDLPPAVRAMLVLDRLLGPWRALISTDELFVSFRANRGLPKTREGVSRITTNRLREDARDFIAEWVDLTNLPDEAARKTMDKELVSYRESHGRVITTHQLRKCFGYFASNIDRRLMPMLQMNFHHVSAAMTDGAYTGNPVLERDLNDVRYQNLALESLEIARGNSGMAGRYGEQLERKIIAELGPQIAGLSAEDAYLEAFIYVEQAGIDRLFFEPYGICGALSASEMACHEIGGTTDIARWEPRLTPNYETRQPSLCAGCACFAIARRHRSYWEVRYIDNAAQLQIFEALGRTGPLVDGALALTEAQAQQALVICSKLGSDMDELERRLAAEVTETLHAA